MRDDQLVCAACSGRVVDGNCPTCRRTREMLRGGGRDLRPELLALLIAVITLLTLVAVHAG